VRFLRFLENDKTDLRAPIYFRF